MNNNVKVILIVDSLIVNEKIITPSRKYLWE